MKRILVFIMLLILIISVSSVSASDIDNQTIKATDDIREQIISADDMIEEDLAISDLNRFSAADYAVDDGVNIIGDSGGAADYAVDDGVNNIDDRVTSAADVIGDNGTSDVNQFNSKDFVMTVDRVQADGQGSFSELQDLINKNSIVNLTKDYSLKSSKPITISKDITINGNGHLINANRLGGIFEIKGGNVLLRDLILYKGLNENGGAINVQSASGFICENILFKDNRAAYFGGSVYVKATCPTTFKDCAFLNTYADDDGFEKSDTFVIYKNFGGAIYSVALITIESCTFFDAYADDRGGAIYTEGNLVLRGYNEFSQNTAVDFGGAIYSKGDVYVNLYDDGSTFFKSNEAKTDAGGAIYSEKNVYVKNANFTGNYADDYGGAIYANGKVFINSSNFTGNFAKHQGGAIYNKDYMALSGYNYFVSNEAKDSGGAIYTARFAETVSHAVFRNNKAGDDGGAVYINRGNTIAFTDCDFENNHAGDEGGAIYLDDKDSHLSVYKNNFVNNTASSGYTVYNCGNYDAIKDNWHGSTSPNFNNQFKEWRFLVKDKVHTPTSYSKSRIVW